MLTLLEQSGALQSVVHQRLVAIPISKYKNFQAKLITSKKMKQTGQQSTIPSYHHNPIRFPPSSSPTQRTPPCRRQAVLAQTHPRDLYPNTAQTQRQYLLSTHQPARQSSSVQICSSQDTQTSPCQKAYMLLFRTFSHPNELVGIPARHHPSCPDRDEYARCRWRSGRP